MRDKYRFMIETTSICNAKCKFCSNPILNREKMNMREPIFEKIISRIIEERIDIEKFILHLNGEPFCDPLLINRINILKDKFPGIPIWFTTNFSIPNKEMIEKLLTSGVDTLTISLNATDKKNYHEITGLNYDFTMSNIEYLMKRNCELGKIIDIRLSIVDYGEKEYVKEFIDKYSSIAEIRVLKLGRWVGKEYKEFDNRAQNINRYCDDLYHQICILSNGDYAICCFDCEGSTNMNVEDVAILEAFNSRVYTKLREDLKSGILGTMCENCSFTYI